MRRLVTVSLALVLIAGLGLFVFLQSRDNVQCPKVGNVDRVTFKLGNRFNDTGFFVSLTQDDLHHGVGWDPIKSDQPGDKDGDGVFYEPEIGAYHVVMSGPGAVSKLNVPWNFDKPFKLRVSGTNDNDSVFYGEEETFRFKKVRPKEGCGSRTYLEHVFKASDHDS